VIGDETMRPALARAAQVSPDGTGCAAATTVPALLDDVTAQAGDDVCRTCGACCSYSADWPRFSLEPAARLDLIPPELVADDESGMRCVGGRCAALVGTVGQSTSCAIHPLRPAVCRACSPGDPECRVARRHFGLDEAPPRDAEPASAVSLDPFAMPSTDSTETHMSDRFCMGQTVRLVRSSLRTAADGAFKIVRALPDDGGETQYRIKSAREPHERVVKESDLSRD